MGRWCLVFQGPSREKRDREREVHERDFRVIKQLLEKEGMKKSNEKWTTWERGREASNAITQAAVRGGALSTGSQGRTV